MHTPFATWLLIEIAKRGLSVKAFSDELAVSKTTVHRWLNGQTKSIRRQTIARIGQILNVPFESLIQRINETVSPIPDDETTRPPGSATKPPPATTPAAAP